MGSLSSFPPVATSLIDWAKLGQTPLEVNGHIEVKYDSKSGNWGEPLFVKDPYVRIHGLAPALNYGQQAFEGLKAYRNRDDSKILVFRPEKNAARLQYSSSYILIPPVPTEVFLRSVEAAVSLNAEYVPPYGSGAFLYIRPLVFGSSGHLPLTPPNEYTFSVYVYPLSAYHGASALKALVLEDFDRTAPFGTGSAKLGGNYAPVIPWMEKAKYEGFGITLHLDSKTRSEIDEFSTSGFIGVLRDANNTDNTKLVIPSSRNIIQSITSESCQELARSFGWDVEVRSIKFEELVTFNEVFAAGTAASIVPISSITHRSSNTTFNYSVPTGKNNTAYERLRKALLDVQMGNDDGGLGWVLSVQDVGYCIKRK